MPVFGKSEILMVVGHLHNELANIPNSPKCNEFWNKLADFCAGGGRVIGMDANMSMFGVIPEMARRGVDLTLLSYD